MFYPAAAPTDNFPPATFLIPIVFYLAGRAPGEGSRVASINPSNDKCHIFTSARSRSLPSVNPRCEIIDFGIWILAPALAGNNPSANILEILYSAEAPPEAANQNLTYRIF